MAAKIILLVLQLYFIVSVQPGYPPMGDEVEQGSVLLPATRRGRYLANIVRRQAVDGTGIKFNKDADRMNAESKKKVDVLSEDLLPYIIAEQDRRVTLHARIMTAIQNGEKGITIVELRNKPPLIIRKGNLYRCPSNRPMVEPDGSGAMLCEGGTVPTQIIYDSCISAEDRPLYYTTVNGRNKYFFCDRQRVEGADLPHMTNGTVVACHPSIRTSLNYTMYKCALEDTDDVVVHFRYYPDRTYKYVSELDPDKEMCDHWNPCQIGYIFSLPSMDQAKKAEEFYPVDYDEKKMWADFEKDETVGAVMEDSSVENVNFTITNYTTSMRKVKIPALDGWEFEQFSSKVDNKYEKVDVEYTPKTIPKGEKHVQYIHVTLTFNKWDAKYYGKYYLQYKKTADDKEKKYIHFLTLLPASINAVTRDLYLMVDGKQEPMPEDYECEHCDLQSIMLRSTDDNVYILDKDRYKVMDHGKNPKQIILNLGQVTQKDFGDYFAVFVNAAGEEERIKIFHILGPAINDNTDHAVEFTHIVKETKLQEKVEEKDKEFKCKPEKCELISVLHNGKNVLSDKGPVTQKDAKLTIVIDKFTEADAGSYIGYFKFEDGTIIYLDLIDLITVDGITIKPTEAAKIAVGDLVEHHSVYECKPHPCQVLGVSFNGMTLTKAEPTRRQFNPTSEQAVYMLQKDKNAENKEEDAVVVRIRSFTAEYAGTYLVEFLMEKKKYIKVLCTLELTPGRLSGKVKVKVENETLPKVENEKTNPKEDNVVKDETNSREDNSPKGKTDPTDENNPRKEKDTKEKEEPREKINPNAKDDQEIPKQD